jgi:hypothetical protein
MSRSASNQLLWHFGWRRSVTGGCVRLSSWRPRGDSKAWFPVLMTAVVASALIRPAVRALI